jgi:hypothetical protein
LVPRITIFLIKSCKIKHKGINGNANLIIWLGEINGQGPNRARNALSLFNEFCRSSLQKFVEAFVAANRSLVECMPFWIGLSIAIPSLLRQLTISFSVLPATE